jgi:hypothetical protein
MITANRLLLRFLKLLRLLVAPDVSRAVRLSAKRAV